MSQEIQREVERARDDIKILLTLVKISVPKDIGDNMVRFILDIDQCINEIEILEGDY